MSLKVRILNARLLISGFEGQDGGGGDSGLGP